jgi:hypothetical protein
MPKENDLEGHQDQGGKHGGQAGMPDPQPSPSKALRDARRARKSDTPKSEEKSSD